MLRAHQKIMWQTDDQKTLQNVHNQVIEEGEVLLQNGSHCTANYEKERSERWRR